MLQEAEDARNPLIERFRFLGIFSNNTDEFYRVRVASIKRLIGLKSKVKKTLGNDPELLLKEIQRISAEQRERFERAYVNLVDEASQKGIRFINEKDFNKSQLKEIGDYFHDVVRTSLVPIMLDPKKPLPEIHDKSIYLAIKLSNSKSGQDIRYALIEVPTKTLPRFKVLSESSSTKRYIVMLDDIIRAHLKDIFAMFDYKQICAYAVKVTRDAELDLDNEDLTLTLLEQVSKSIHSRKVALPVRFVFDKKIAPDLKKFLFKKLKLDDGDKVIAGGRRYHNFKDFIDFPNLDRGKHVYAKLPPLKHPDLKENSVLQSVAKKDILLNYPYHSFDPIIDMLREAAMDPKVKSIKINLYRVARNSKVINALVNAAKNGKVVVALIELRARFDEENNIFWSNKLSDEGVRVIMGIQGLKVHSKLILITRKEKGKSVHYAHVGTGNFHEGTATVYTDTSLLTSDKRIASEVAKVFDFFDNNFKTKRYTHLIFSPAGTRRRFMELINNEIKFAKKGEKARMIIKMNNLADEEMIKKLYQASKAGVEIDLIIRGICSLISGVPGLSDNIRSISVVDRFLEHSRIIYFHHGGEKRVYISSADWMTRNLDHRVEVSCPVYDENLKQELLDMLEIQMNDDVKGRYLGECRNEYVKKGNGKNRSQIQLYKYFKNQIV